MQTSVPEVCPCPSPFPGLSPVRVICVVITGDKTDVVDEKVTIRIESLAQRLWVPKFGIFTTRLQMVRD